MIKIKIHNQIIIKIQILIIIAKTLYRLIKLVHHFKI